MFIAYRFFFGLHDIYILVGIEQFDGQVIIAWKAIQGIKEAL